MCKRRRISESGLRVRFPALTSRGTRRSRTIARRKAPEPLTNGSPKAVFIVEDHPVFREGLVQILNDQQDVAIVGQAGSAEEAMEAISRLKPDLVLVDISLPGKTGLELIKEVRGMGLRLKYASWFDGSRLV